MFDCRIGGIFAGSIVKRFFGLQVFDGLFGICFFGCQYFTKLDFAAALVVFFAFVIGLANFLVADGVGLDDVGNKGFGQQLGLEVFPLLFKVGMFIGALFFG